jgi:DNA primase
MAFPPGFLDELRSRVALADLVGRRVRLVRRGREHGGLCPFHNEKTPSFYVVEDKGFFHCFGCGAHGDAIGFLMRADNLDFIEAVERLAAEAGIAVPQQTPQERERAQRQKTLLEALAAAASFYEAQLWSPSGRRAREYLVARGLDEETIRRFRLGWAPDDRQSLRRSLGGEFPEPLLLEAGLLRASDHGGSPYDYFGGRVMFPIGDRAGRVIAFGARTMGDDQPKYLNSPDTPVFEKGRVLYGWSAARANIGGERDPGGHGVIVVEGYMDVIALHRAGIGTAVAPLGTALTEIHLRELWRLSPEPVLCFDGDTAGQRAALRALGRALPLLQPGHSLQFCALPPGEDPDSLIRGRGRPVFEEFLRRAQPLSGRLWQAELDVGATDTPERRADLRARLKNRTDAIADKVVRGEYWGFLLDQFYQLVRSFRLERLAKRSPGDAAKERVPSPPPPPGPTQRTLLLRALIETPDEIEHHVEELTILDFPEPELDRLRWELLEVAEMRPDLDAEALHQHLGQSGFAETVGALSSRLLRHGLRMRYRSEPAVNRFELAELFRELRSSDDLETAVRAFALNPTEENWERLRALKEREWQSGDVEEEAWRSWRR